MKLSHRSFGPAEGPVALLLHGVLGSGGNLLGLARGLNSRHPTWRFVLPDLRGHGDSPGGPADAPHTLAACAADLAELATEVGPPRVVVGHSFGGKLALLYAREHGGLPLRHVWVLDAPPGASSAPDHEVRRVLAAAQALVPPFASRDTVITHFRDRGFSPAIAAWMTTNVRRDGEVLRWRPDLDVVEALLADYFLNDLWPFLEHPGHIQPHFIRAGRSDRWDAATLARLEALKLDVRVLPEAGHWVHVDEPQQVMDLISESL